jgi:hypothetical protein
MGCVGNRVAGKDLNWRPSGYEAHDGVMDLLNQPLTVLAIPFPRLFTAQLVLTHLSGTHSWHIAPPAFDRAREPHIPGDALSSSAVRSPRHRFFRIKSPLVIESLPRSNGFPTRRTDCSVQQ